MFSDLLPQLWQQSWSHWEKCKHHYNYEVKVISSIHSSRYLCTCMFFMLQQLSYEIFSISNSQIIIGISSVLSLIIPLLDCNGLPSFTMENFLVIFFLEMKVYLLCWCEIVHSDVIIFSNFSFLWLYAAIRWLFFSMLLNGLCFSGEKQTPRWILVSWVS